MSCTHLEERLALYAGGDLDPVEAAKIELHLNGCAECRAFLGEMNASLAALQTETLEWAAVDVMHQRTISALRPAAFPFWRYAAAVAVVMGGLASWHFKPSAPIPLPVVSAAVTQPKMLPVIAPVVVRAKKARRVEKHESMVVKLQTDDPDVVIYWITD